MEQLKKLKDMSSQSRRTHVEFGLKKGRKNSTVVSTNTPGLKTSVMAHSKIKKKPMRQGKAEVTLDVKQKKSHKEKEQKTSLQ